MYLYVGWLMVLKRWVGAFWALVRGLQGAREAHEVDSERIPIGR